MPFPYDSTGIDPSQGPLLPAGRWFKFKIVEANDRDKDGGPRITKNGDPMVNLKCVVVDDAQYMDRTVYHNITFLPKDSPGAGIAIHFLKCIDEPWEGKIDVDPEKWVFKGATFMGKIGHREYNGKKMNQIVEVSKLLNDTAPPLAATSAAESEIPF